MGISINYGSAKQQIDIKSVEDNILLLSNKRYRCILETSAINFELKSEDEQDALIDIYRQFLNSINGPLQILVRTREIELDSYRESLSARALKEKTPIYKQQLESYSIFLSGLIAVNKILTRSFYIIVPYDGSSKEDADLIKEQLALRVDIVSKGLQRLGMHTRILSGLEILSLFYSFYNPSTSKTQPLTSVALSMLHASFVGEKVNESAL